VFREGIARGLLEDKGFASRVRRTSLTTRNGRVSDGLYVTVLPSPNDTRSGEDVLRHFLRQLRDTSGFQACKQKLPARGTLSLRFVLPGSGEVNEDGLPARISFRLGGPLAQAPLGRCIAETIAPLAAAFTLPPDLSRAEMSQTVELP
jgi:hypothetical protein